MHNELERQKKAREDNARKLVEMIGEIEGKVEQEIEEERKARRQTNEALLNLLEETCVKVERAFY